MKQLGVISNAVKNDIVHMDEDDEDDNDQDQQLFKVVDEHG